jgi:ankyrin repeat protein
MSLAHPAHPCLCRRRAKKRAEAVVPLTERQQLALLKKKSQRDAMMQNVNKRNASGETHLHVAAIKGDLDLVQDLIQHNAEVNTKDHAGWTPLHEACNHGFLEIARILLDNGANINAPGMDNDTPLHDASVNCHLEVVSLLIERGVNIVSAPSSLLSTSINSSPVSPALL